MFLLTPEPLGDNRLQATIKLKWNQDYMDEAMISTHPLSLRDGSLIAYCDEQVRVARTMCSDDVLRARTVPMV